MRGPSMVLYYSLPTRADLVFAGYQLSLSDEMKSKVLSPLHALRRHLDHVLALILPPPPSPVILSSLETSRTSNAAHPDPFPAGKVGRWTSLYHMVTFRPDVGYAEAKRRERWQKEMVERVLQVGGVSLVGVGVWWAVGWGRLVRGGWVGVGGRR